MVKKDSKGTSFRLKQEAVWMLQDLTERWKCSQTAAVEQAISLAHGTWAGTPHEAPPERERHDTPAMQRYTEQRIAEIPIVDTRPKNCTCQHCPERFASASRYATICPKCTEAGHRNLPVDCDVCHQFFAA